MELISSPAPRVPAERPTGSPAAGLAPGATCPIEPLDPEAPLGDSIDGLRGLEAVAVLTDYLTEPAPLKGKLRAEVRQRVERRLEEAGLRVVSAKDLAELPGQPRLEFYLSTGDPETGCPFRVSISLRQQVVLGRATGTALYGGTWSKSGPSRLGFDEGAEVESITYYLESFIADWRTANSSAPRKKAVARRTTPELTWGQWLDRALGITLGVGLPLRAGENDVVQDPNIIGPDREPPSTPTFSTTLSLNWPDTGWFGRLTLYQYLEPSHQQPWNPDFAYAFGYDDYRPGTFSLTYGNYGGNRFDPDGEEAFTRLEEGSIRAAYKLAIEDRVFAPLYTEESRIFACQPAISTTPRYFDQASNSDKSFKTSLSFGCRYYIWRSLFVGGTAFLYPDPDQQQDWDPDYSYSFGWSNWRPGTFSLEYSNSSGNRWPWRDGGSRFLDGAVSLTYRVPLEEVIDWFAEP